MVYEDDPIVPLSSYYVGNWMKFFFIRTPFWPIYLLLVPIMAFLFFTGNTMETWYVVIVATLVILLVNLATTIKKYQIFNDKMRISLGWTFHFDIPFNNIENAREVDLKDLWGLCLNFISNRPGDDAVQITRKRGWKVNIIPSNRKLFLENLNKAMNEFKGHYVSF